MSNHRVEKDAEKRASPQNVRRWRSATRYVLMRCEVDEQDMSPQLVSLDDPFPVLATNLPRV